jgi:hypothetical protein
VTTLATQLAVAHHEAGHAVASSESYSLWNDPDFWNVCELLADLCLDSSVKLPTPSHSDASENPSPEKG